MTLQTQEKASLPGGTRVFSFNGVPVVARADYWPLPFIVTGVLTWLAGLRHPEFTWLQRLGVGLLAMPVATIADVGHAMAHTVSARLAGAPMDEIFLSSGMPRTLYENNDVPPSVHIRRSLGGPVFSLTCFTLSLLWRRASPPGSISRDLADASLAGHTVILAGSLTPLPMVDGGIIMKWKLVETGRTPAQADRIVHRASLGLGAAFIGLGAVVGLLGKRKLVGGLLAAAGLAGIAGGLDWLK